jgi:hypothetical protein
MPAGRRLPVAGVDDVPQRGGRGELGGEIVMRPIRHQDLRAAVAENAGQLGRRQPEIERRHHAAGPRHRKQGFEIAMAVLGQDGDATAPRQLQRAQGAGQARHPLGEQRPAELALVVGHCQRRTAQPGRPAQGLAEAEPRPARARSDHLLSLHAPPPNPRVL